MTTTIEPTTTTDELWFLATRVAFPVRHADGADGISVVRSRARRGDSPPLHVHETEDEVFHVIEGTLRFSVDGAVASAGPGESFLAPKGVPHTYCVDSDHATWLAVTTHGDFERFVRAVARPAAHDGLPPAEPPTEEQQRALAEAATAHGILLVGPPLV